jgi:uracil-DNA glycosylase family 4
MRWTERQQAMLREMGIRLWQPDGPAAEVVPAPAEQPAGADDNATPVKRASARPPHAAEAREAAAACPAGIETMDWPALREAVANCTACKLCKGRTQTVFGIGHPRAHWMIVGEAPGEQEDQRGEPFVGKSGQLLDNMLRAIGLTREEASPARQVYIANTVKCRPPQNRNPELQELAQCEPFLIRQVGLVQPKIILAMGRFAVQSLLRSNEPIGRLRGRVHRYQGVPLIVTYHPAYLLRSLDDKAKAWDDLCLAVQTLRDVQPV